MSFLTDPGRYDRPDPCDDCGQPHRGDCPEPWPDDDYGDSDDWPFWHRLASWLYGEPA